MLFSATIGGRKIETVFNNQGSNYVSLRHMVYALEGITHEQNQETPRDKQKVVWDADSKWAIFRITDRFTGEQKVIEFSIEDIKSDKAPTMREVKVNGVTAGSISFVFSDSLNMIGVRELARLAGLENYLQWYNKDNTQYVDLRAEDPFFGQGSMKKAVDAIVNNQGGIPANQNGDFYQVLYGTANKGGKVNRYCGYVFSVMDAAQWLIQTGGGIKFAVQIRDTKQLLNKNEQIQVTVNGQYEILQKFVLAKQLLAKCGYQVKMPGFIIGTPEENVNISCYGADGAKAIYQGIINKLVESGCPGNEAKQMIAGIYFGSETAMCNNALVKEIKDYVNDQEGKLVWIPYFVSQEDLAKIKEVAVFFDKVILQPSTFYLKEAYYKGKDKNGCYVDPLDDSLRWKDIFDLVSTNTTKFGIELEYDMGLVTGRSDRRLPMSPAEKKSAFIEYIDKIIPRIGGMPIGIYSGGPNEQGYNNILLNSNLHNDENHVPTVDGFGTGSNYSDLYGGNLIYTINSILFSSQSNEQKRVMLRELVSSI